MAQPCPSSTDYNSTSGWLWLPSNCQPCSTHLWWSHFMFFLMIHNLHTNDLVHHSYQIGYLTVAPPATINHS
jgi:hypothetical protein